jgi:hypothetical protein
MISMTQIPTTHTASSIGMSACGHASLTGGAMGSVASIPATRVAGVVRGGFALPTPGQVANFAAKRDYATTGSDTWRPPTS